MNISPVHLQVTHLHWVQKDFEREKKHVCAARKIIIILCNMKFLQINAMFTLYG